MVRGEGSSERAGQRRLLRVVGPVSAEQFGGWHTLHGRLPERGETGGNTGAFISDGFEELRCRVGQTGGNVAGRILRPDRDHPGAGDSLAVGRRVD